MSKDHMIGQVLGGKYTLRELMAEEELGRLYTADGPADGPVSVKLLKPLDHQNPERVARFGREMMATALVRHPGCVALIDFGTEGVLHYVVFEALGGRRLSELLREAGRLEPLRAARIALGIGSALEAAHAEKVLHRNLHPGNVLVGDEDAVKVCDFGLCRLEEAEGDAKLTLKGTRLGTPAYMAPEYVSFFEAGPKGDVYALGILIFEMLVGQPPFTGSEDRILALHAEAPAPPPSAVRPDVPEWLDALVVRLLDKDRERRPDARTVVAELSKRTSVPSGRPWWSFWSR